MFHKWDWLGFAFSNGLVMVCAIACEKIIIIYNYDLFFIKIIVTLLVNVFMKRFTNTKFGPYDKDFSHIYIYITKF